MDSSTALPIWHPTVPGCLQLSPLAVKRTFANGTADNEQVVSGPVLLQTLPSNFLTGVAIQVGEVAVMLGR